MEGSVKERLTGALIFVAAVVVIVPEMFSGPDTAPAAAPAHSAEAGPPLRTYSMTLNDSGDSRGIAPPAAVPEIVPVEPPAAPQPAAVEPAPVAVAPVAAAATTAPMPEPVTAAAVGNWWLRIGIFGVRDNAERLATTLRTAGFSVAVDKQIIGGKDMYRVRAGPVRDRAEALGLQARLKASGNDSLLLPP